MQFTLYLTLMWWCWNKNGYTATTKSIVLSTYCQNSGQVGQKLEGVWRNSG